MTRNDADADREALKEEIKGELKQDAARRKALGCGACLILMFAAIAVPVLFALSMAAKTGFVEVPVLSGWLYKPSEPVRVVYALAGSNAEQVLQAVTTRVVYDPAVSTLTLRMNEVQATTLAQGLVKNTKDLPFAAAAAQIAIEKDYVEFFFVSVRPARNATVRVRVVPEAKDGRLVMSVKELLVGSLVVPAPIANYMIGVFGAPVLKSMETYIGQVGEIRDISLEKGAVTAVIRTNRK